MMILVRRLDLPVSAYEANMPPLLGIGEQLGVYRYYSITSAEAPEANALGKGTPGYYSSGYEELK